MDATTHPIEILYCPICKVGMDAALSRHQACPRCGAKRRVMHGIEHWSEAENLIAVPADRLTRTRHLISAYSL